MKGGGGEGGGGGDATGGPAAAAAHTMKPFLVSSVRKPTLPVYHVIAAPIGMGTLRGPVLPLYLIVGSSQLILINLLQCAIWIVK